MDANKVKRAVMWCLEDLTWDNGDKEYDIKCEVGTKFALTSSDVKGLQQEVIVNQLMKHPNVKAWLRQRVQGFVQDVFDEAEDLDDGDCPNYEAGVTCKCESCNEQRKEGGCVSPG